MQRFGTQRDMFEVLSVELPKRDPRLKHTTGDRFNQVSGMATRNCRCIDGNLSL
jgi:hypothetical protein